MTPSSGQLPTVVFDGGCSFCRRQERLIKRLDWLGRVTTLPYDFAVEQWPEISRGALGDGLRVRFPDGSVTIAIDAVRSIAVRMPLTALPALLLWVPGIRGLAALAYGFVARRRQRDRDADDSCAI
ncbi:MAG: DCC1-like thiol-disulfide oxidoreductase family protein [Gaiellales bacterium]